MVTPPIGATIHCLKFPQRCSIRFPTLFDCSLGLHHISSSDIFSMHLLSFGRKSPFRKIREASMNSWESLLDVADVGTMVLTLLNSDFSLNGVCNETLLVSRVVHPVLLF